MARSDFSKNVLTLISGTTIAQIISMGISPILSRMYSPDDFGMLAAFSAVVGIMSLLAGLRYEGAILLPKKEEDAANMLAISLFLNVFISFLFFVGIYVLSFFLVDSVNDKELFNWYYLAPVFTLFTGFSQSVINWFNRKKEYKRIVYFRVVNSAANSGGSLTLGYTAIHFNGLIFSLIMSSIVSIAVFLTNIKSDFLQYRSVISRKRMLEMAREYKRFPLINSIQSLSDALQIYGIVYFIDQFFGQVVLGIYSFAMRILLVPMNFIGAAMAQVFYQQASETYNHQGDLKALIRNTMFKSALLAVPVLIVLVLFGPWLFSFVFGEKWYNAGVYARILAPWMLLDFVRAPLSQIPIIISRQNRLLTISLISNLIVVITMLYAGFVLKDLKSGLIVLSCIQSVFILGVIGWIYKIASVQR